MWRRGPCRGTKTHEIDGEDKSEKRGRRGLLVVAVVAVVVGERHDDAQRVRDAEERTLRRFSEVRRPRPIQGTLLGP
jgi:hypothetical protein